MLLLNQFMCLKRLSLRFKRDISYILIKTEELEMAELELQRIQDVAFGTPSIVIYVASLCR